MDFSNLNNSDCLIVLSLDQSLNEKLTNSKLIDNKEKSTALITNLPSVKNAFQYIFTVEQKFSDDQLKNLFELLKPNSSLIIVKTNQTGNLSFLLKSNGFLVEQQNGQDYTIARKPEYEIGSSVKVNTKKVWSLAADDIADGDLIDDDALLDEGDKTKPKPEDLRVCASTKQRKACANCTCGLKEELENEEIEKLRKNTQNVKSSCGNCYLGDAFRCESCPYRGLPAFKPGEKVVIDNTDDL